MVASRQVPIPSLLTFKTLIHRLQFLIPQHTHSNVPFCRTPNPDRFLFIPQSLGNNALSTRKPCFPRRIQGRPRDSSPHSASCSWGVCIELCLPQPWSISDRFRYLLNLSFHGLHSCTGSRTQQVLNEYSLS